MKFTTRDRDNDKWTTHNCAVHNAGNAGGWWYNGCSHLNLNHQHNNIHLLYLNHHWYYLSLIEINKN